MSVALLEREAQVLEQRPALVVVGGGRDHGDVHAARPVDLVLVDLVEHDLLGQPEGVVAPAVELVGVQTAEVTDARQRERQQAVEELPHPVTTQRDVRADRHALAQLELRDGLAGLGDLRLLAGDRGEVLDRTLDQLGVTRSLADTHVDHDLGQAGHLHHVGVAELLTHRGEDLLAVAHLHPRHRGRLGRLSHLCHQISSPDFRATRTLRVVLYVEPSGRRLVASTRLNPSRVVPLPSTSITLDTWIGASVVTMPPLVPARPPWLTTLVCFLTRFTPSTITRCSSRSTEMTLPSAPLSLPAMTRTVSPFLMFTLISEHLRSQRNDLHELLLAQLAAHGAEDAGASRLAIGLEDHGGVLVEADVGTVLTTALLHGPHDHGLDDVALLDVAPGDRVLDGGNDDVADAGVAPTRAAEDTDAEDLLGTRVVGDLESRLLLDHRYFSWLSCWFSAACGGEPCRTGGLVWFGGWAPGLLGLLEDLHDAPALGRRQRPRLHDQDPVTDAAVVLLVVGLELRRTPQHLAVERVLDPVLDRDDDGLVHLVADDQALADLAPGVPLGSLLGGLDC